MGQLQGLSRSNSVVILEIGGNDLLGATSHSDFASALDCLLGTLTKQGHTLVMFELPQLLFLSDVGRTQRMLARKYNVILLPKTYMTRVFSMPGATLDGLHLSEAGHRAMAELIFQSISP